MTKTYVSNVTSIRAAVFVQLVCLLLSGCETERGPISAPERPVNVPEHAQWGGGIDGGMWFTCKPLKEQWHYSCVVYNDYNGMIEDQAEYVLRSVYWDEKKGKAVIEVPDSLTLQYDGFDGDSIYLLNSFYLQRKHPRW